MSQRSFATGVDLLFFGVMNVQGDLMPAALPANKDVRFKMICTECDDPTPLEQRYLCTAHPDEHGPFVVSTAGRAKVVGSGKTEQLYKVTDEQIAALKTPTLPEKQMTVHVFDADTVNAATIPSGNAYRLRPSGRLDLYAVLVDLVANPQYAFVGEMTVKGTQKMWRISSRSGQLFLSELVRPADVAPGDNLDDVVYDAAALEMVTKLAADNLEEFDPAAFADVIAERAREMNDLLASGKGEKVPTAAPEQPAAATGGDLMDILASAAAAAGSKKTARKKTAAKK